jgi:putative endonuclease
VGRRSGRSLVCGSRLRGRRPQLEIVQIDLVVCSDSTVVFCEIKTRASDRYGPPEAAVGHVKQRRLRLLAVEWLAAHDRHGAIRFDVAAITGARIEVFEAAF